MNWISITTDTLNEAKVAALIEACSTAALEEGQGNRAAGIIQGVVDEIRRKIASCANNRVDADATTIPKGLRDLAVDLIIARLKSAVELTLTDDERHAVERRLADLNRIADCKDAVEQPDHPVSAQVEKGGASQVIHQSTHNPTGKTLGGL